MGMTMRSAPPRAKALRKVTVVADGYPDAHWTGIKNRIPTVTLPIVIALVLARALEDMGHPLLAQVVASGVEHGGAIVVAPWARTFKQIDHRRQA